MLRRFPSTEGRPTPGRLPPRAEFRLPLVFVAPVRRLVVLMLDLQTSEISERELRSAAPAPTPSRSLAVYQRLMRRIAA